MKTVDFLLTTATFIAFVIVVYLFSTDPTFSKSTNWAEEGTPAPAKALLKSEKSSINLHPERSEWASKINYPPGSKWKYIIIHHSATKQGNITIFDNYHRKEKGMKEGLSYHFVIGNGTKSKDGEIEIGKRWEKQIAGEHCYDSKINQESIGICLVGNFDEDKTTVRQIESLVNLINDLQKQYNIPNDRILTHQEVDKKRTNCPGKYFQLKEIKSRLPNAF